MLWIKKIKEHKSIKDKAVSLLNVTAGKNDGNLINENLMKLTGGDRDELERRRQILGGM